MLHRVMLHPVETTLDSVASVRDGVRKPGAVRKEVVVNQERCKACGLCIKHCPTHALSRGTHINGMGYEAVEAHVEACIGCGRCFYTCPEPDAIRIVVIRQDD